MYFILHQRITTDFDQLDQFEITQSYEKSLYVAKCVNKLFYFLLLSNSGKTQNESILHVSSRTWANRKYYFP